MRRSFLAITFLFFALCSFAESEQAAPYIPKNLDDAHAQLLQTLSVDDLARIKAMKSEDQMAEHNFDLGMGLRNTWGLWSGSRLAKYFNQLGVYHPDDMSSIILATFWCKLHDKPFELDRRVVYYREYWLSMERPKGASPKDGAKIAWVIIQGSGKKAVHLGISASDNSYWRFAYSVNASIQPANQDEAKKLDELRSSWKSVGAKAEDFIRD